jgi:hypothetical protein
LDGFKPVNLGSNCKHPSHYTTEDDFDTSQKNVSVEWLAVLYIVGRGLFCRSRCNLWDGREMSRAFHHHHHWIDSPTWSLVFVRSFCQLYFSIATFLQSFTPKVLISWITSHAFMRWK